VAGKKYSPMIAGRGSYETRSQFQESEKNVILVPCLHSVSEYISPILELKFTKIFYLYSDEGGGENTISYKYCI
jgi:hypothetical protein